MFRKQPFMVFIVTRSALKRYMILDMGFGTGAYYLVDWVSSSVIIAIVSSIALTELVRKLGRMWWWGM